MIDELEVILAINIAKITIFISFIINNISLVYSIVYTAQYTVVSMLVLQSEHSQEWGYFM